MARHSCYGATQVSNETSWNQEKLDVSEDLFIELDFEFQMWDWINFIADDYWLKSIRKAAANLIAETML